MSRVSKVAKASMLLMLGTVLSKVLGFARELIVAYKFGAGSITDAFVLTNSIPTVVFTSISTAISINYIPYYYRLEGTEEKNRFTTNLANICIIILLLGCFVICSFPKATLKVFAMGLPSETEKYAVIMLRIVVFTIIPIILAYIFQAYLQANESFVSTAAYGVVNNVVVILFILSATAEKYYVLSVGTIVSHIVGLLVILYFVRRETTYKYTVYINVKDQNIKNLVVLTAPLVIEDLASAASLLVDRNLASFLDKGAISSLSYAGTLSMMASTVIVSAIMTASFPTFSRLLSMDNRQKFEELLYKYAYVIGYLLGPISIFMIFNATDIVTLFFEHGAFDENATVIVTESLIWYTVGLLPAGLQVYLIRAFYAIQDNKTPVKIKVFALGCNVILNLATVSILRHKGIALSTSISYAISLILLMVSLKKKHSINNFGKVLVDAGGALLIGGISEMVVCFVFGKLIHISNLISKIVLEGIMFFLIYVVIVSLTRRKIIRDVLEIIKSK